MADTRESVADLVAKVKAYQRRGEDYKQRWYSYVQSKGSPNYDPNRHDIFTLREFLAKIERNEIEIDESIRQGSHLNAAEAAKAQLVGQVKAYQRLGDEYKQKWYSFLHIKGAIHYDPNRQDMGLLKEFLIKHDAEGLGLNKQAEGWTCMKCGDHQFARNQECRVCGAAKSEAAMPTSWACPACGDDQPYENTACRMCGEPHNNQNIEDYTMAYMYMAQALNGGAAGSSGDGTTQRANDLMNWNSASALNINSKSKDSVETELWAQRMARSDPDGKSNLDPEQAAAAAAAAFAMQSNDPEAAAAAMAALEAQGVNLPWFGGPGAEGAGAVPGTEQYAESFDSMSFGKRPLSMQQYDPVEAFDAGAALELAIAAQAQEPQALQADDQPPAEEPPRLENAPPQQESALVSAPDERGGERRRRSDDDDDGRRRPREGRDRSRPRRDRSRRRDRADRSRSRQEAARAKRKSGWDDGAPPEGMSAPMFPFGQQQGPPGMGAPPMPGAGGPPPMHSYPPLGQNQQRPGAKDWSAGFAAADGQAPKKGRPGDWICPACKNINFSSRKICHNDKCKGTAAGAERIGLKPGDWICPTCGDLVFASKSKCKMCQTPKQVGTGEVVGVTVPIGLPGGDWTCPNCADHQFARNSECRLCKTPRPLTGIMWTCPSCGDSQDSSHATCRMCGEGQPKGAFKGCKGGCCKGGGKARAVAFDPQDPIASINAQAANFDPNFDPNMMAMAPVNDVQQQLLTLQTNWSSWSNAAPGAAPAPVGMTHAGPAAAKLGTFTPGMAAPAPSLAPEALMNWNVTEEDKWAGDGWTNNPKKASKYQPDGSTKEDWKLVGWQDNSAKFASNNVDDWKSVGWQDNSNKSSGWKD